MYGTYLPKKPRRVLVLGSGALQIGQAGEFDYSGSQAIKALKEDGIRTVLVNPNIATVQTSAEMADQVYLQPVTPEAVEEIIEKEEVDGVLLSFGGQTALNCGVALHDSGVFDKHGVRVLGTSVQTIKDTEDRHLFISRLNEIGVQTAKSKACRTADEAKAAALELGLPVMLRAAFSLGGKGSGIVESERDLDDALQRAFAGGAPQVLVEECLRGWKEIEYEVVRDGRDNCITVCNMENFDPMGIHTGESIVVAPSQTLNNEEYQLLRSIAIKTIRHLGIVGECNIQYALNPDRPEYRVIEVNARLSRSSALASKATGYPLAYVAAKLGVGYSLTDIPNGITRRTTAFFEPALDYIVCKIPRWDLAKFPGASRRIGSEMKSVGEVMAIGRTFPEVVQKALRMLDIGVKGLDPDAFHCEDIERELREPTPHRIFSIARALRDGYSVEQISEATDIDPWFLHELAATVAAGTRLRETGPHIDPAALRRAKQLGYSDESIATLTGVDWKLVRERRKSLGIAPIIAQIDTMAAEFPADTNYLYSTYHGSANDIERSRHRQVLVLGSGPYRIGSSVEFDWCSVNAIQAAQDLGLETITLNCNPETVSTDYDMCDKLIFDEISLETVLDVWEREQPDGVLVSMGGQVPNNLAIKLHEMGVRVLGTSPTDIDRAEDRTKFSALLDELGIDQPKWAHISDVSVASEEVERLGGFPVLVRPSYVLSGAAMAVAHEPNELKRILGWAAEVSPDHPVVVSKFESHAREVEIDAVADQGRLVLWAISEHIEDAGVHSGDATMVLPPQTLYLPTMRKAKRIAATLAESLGITGPFNIQFLAKRNVLKVIECNLRASRSFPFVSKVTGNNFAQEAMRRMLGVTRSVTNKSVDLEHVGVKAPMFSFSRIVGADPMLGVEMTSTGEVGVLGDDLHEALLLALTAAGFRAPRQGVILSLGPVEDKYWFADEVRAIATGLKLPLFATEGTAEMIGELDVPCTAVTKRLGNGYSAIDAMKDGRADLVINIPRQYDEQGRPDGYLIRRHAVENGISLITDLQLARAVVGALLSMKGEKLPVKAWNHFFLDSGEAQHAPHFANSISGERRKALRFPGAGDRRS